MNKNLYISIECVTSYKHLPGPPALRRVRVVALVLLLNRVAVVARVAVLLGLLLRLLRGVLVRALHGHNELHNLHGLDNL